MDTKPQSFEASLLFPAALASSDMAPLADDIRTLCEAHGLEARRLTTHTADTFLFDCGTLQALVMGCDRPLDVAHFLDSSRPADALLHETAIMARLTSHRYSMTVLVSDHPERPAEATEAHQSTKERLCWQISDQMRNRLRPSLVFWCENDTLYSGEEFARSGPYASALPLFGPKTLAEGQRQHELQRALEARALTYIQTQIIQGAHKERPRQTKRPVPQQRDSRLPGYGRAIAALELARRNSDQMMRGATMACSTAATGICMLPMLVGAFT